MTSKQRAFLRSLANSIQPIFQVGKGGVTSTLIQQVDDALEARELIKIHVLETAPESVQDIGNQLASATNAVFVQAMGKKITLFRQRKKDSKIELP